MEFIKQENKNLSETPAAENGTSPNLLEKKSEYKPHSHKYESLVFSDSQVGGHPGTIIQKHDKIYKKAKNSEFQMYEFLYSENCPADLQDLKSFLPKYFGTDEINGEEYLILENLHLGFDYPNLVDCKIGRRTWKLDADPKKIENQRLKNLQSISAHFGFRITGLVLRETSGKLLEEIKKPFVETFFTKENLDEYLRKLVSYEGVLQKNLVEEIVSGTENLLEFFKKQKSRRFVASSVYYVIGKNNKVQTRYIDIAHPEDAEGAVDENVIESIEGLIAVWKGLLN